MSPRIFTAPILHQRPEGDLYQALPILVVEPNEGPMQTIEYVLRLKFPIVELEFAPDASAALSRLVAKGIDLLLTEAWLPGAITGMELVHYVRGHYPPHFCAIMAVFESILTCRAVRDLHPVFILVKPVAVEAVVNGVQDAINLRAARITF